MSLKEEYTRTAYVLGKDAVEKLAGARVAVFGVVGVYQQADGFVEQHYVFVFIYDVQFGAGIHKFVRGGGLL